MRYACLFFLCAALMSGQSFQGALRGKVTDPNGAIIADAVVVVTDEGTAIKRSTLTNTEGVFTLSSLTPATYRVTVTAPGFKRAESAGVQVATQASVTLDFTMELGQVSESINVTSESNEVEIASVSSGQTIDRQKLIDLPNLGRNPFMLSKLSEAVVQVGNPKFNRMQDQSGSSQISIAGGPVRGNNYTLDGISITDSINRAVIIPSLEAVQDMKVQSNSYDAEVGRTGGGTFNTFLRSGTNQVHGSAFGYMRETAWLANNFFSNRAGTPIINQPFRNYGGSIGGPIRIPKVYDGRNRTFFWITGEAYRQTEAAGTRLNVPTMLERVGDFSQSLSVVPGSTAQQLIYDPRSITSIGPRTPFANNVIPASQISPIGRAIASFYPQPNVAGVNVYGQLNYDASVAAYNRADQTTWKVDHELFSWWRASASYLHYGSREPSNAWWGGVATPGQSVLFRKVDATQVNSTFTPSPTLVVAVRYGFNRFPNFSTPTSLGFDLRELGLPSSLAAATPFTAFPSISVGGLAGYGGGTTSQNVHHSKSFNTTVSKFRGKHSLKTGFDYRIIQHDGTPAIGPSSFGFTDIFTRRLPNATTQGTGAGLATMLLGLPTSGSMTLATNFYNFVRYYGLFFQDDWRINSKLTLNMGIRYERENGPADRDDNFIVGFDTNAASPLQARVSDPKLLGQVMFAREGNYPRHAGNPNLHRFSPRIGVAYALNSKTAIRGGYGIFWAPLAFTFQSALGYSQSTPIVASFDGNVTPAVTLANPYPTGLLQPVGRSEGGLTGIGQGISIPDIDARSGYVQQYSFDFQRQLPGNFLFASGYIGSKSLQLAQDGRNINQLDPRFLNLGSSLNQAVPNPMFGRGGVLGVGGATITRSQLLRPFPQFTSISLLRSDTNLAVYHAAYFKVQRRFSSGLTALATYTRSQNMDASYGSTGNVFAGTVSGPQNAFAPDAEYSLASTHAPNRLSLSTTYELPFGKGKMLLANNRVMDLLVGGWSMNAVSVMQSGYPLTITQPNDNGIIGANHMRPNATGMSPTPDAPFAKRIDGWFNPAAFSQAPQFTFGNLSRTVSLRGPGQINWDFSLFKTFTIREGFKAQFRAEALNLTNTPMFFAPNTSYTDSAFGRINSQANFSRMVQLGIRFFL
ncbi:MAG: TonB-dependent receptor [Acidobacteria bacterium]|nr:TonB-dependent receptor [Acidobacteriota bacterium]